MLRTGLPIAAALGLVSCTLPGKKQCSDRYTIEVVDAQGEPVTDFDGKAWFDEGGAFVFSCNGTENQLYDELECGWGFIYLDSDKTEPFELELSAPDDSWTWTGTITPVWEEFMPNGPNCEPTCLQGSEVITIQEDSG